jgi:hypothetical protein
MLRDDDPNPHRSRTRRLVSRGLRRAVASRCGGLRARCRSCLPARQRQPGGPGRRPRYRNCGCGRHNGHIQPGDFAERLCSGPKRRLRLRERTIRRADLQRREDVRALLVQRARTGTSAVRRGPRWRRDDSVPLHAQTRGRQRAAVPCWRRTIRFNDHRKQRRKAEPGRATIS